MAYLGELDTYATLFERRLDYVFISANGFVAGPAAPWIICIYQ